MISLVKENPNIQGKLQHGGRDGGGEGVGGRTCLDLQNVERQRVFSREAETDMLGLILFASFPMEYRTRAFHKCIRRLRTIRRAIPSTMLISGTPKQAVLKGSGATSVQRQRTGKARMEVRVAGLPFKVNAPKTELPGFPVVSQRQRRALVINAPPPSLIPPPVCRPEDSADESGALWVDGRFLPT